jgi:hypothetical protein
MLYDHDNQKKNVRRSDITTETHTTPHNRPRRKESAGNEDGYVLLKAEVL